MAWETVVLKVPESKKLSKTHHHDWLCPRCEGSLFMIPSPINSLKGVSTKKKSADEMEFLILICDRCGKFIAFEGCSGDCATYPKSRCEICGRYYCTHCGITSNIDGGETHIELRYCNDHIPEWYRNR